LIAHVEDVALAGRTIEQLRREQRERVAERWREASVSRLANNALNIALQKFEGSDFLVTHDQDLMEEVGTHVWRFEPGRILDFKGPWEEFAAEHEGVS
jgi:hypothetical protein